MEVRIFFDALGHGDAFAVSIAVGAMFLAVVFVFIFAAARRARDEARAAFLEARRRAAYRVDENSPEAKAREEAVNRHIRSLNLNSRA